MLKIQNLSGFGSGRPPSSAAVLNKPAAPDHVWNFDDYERANGLLKINDSAGTVPMWCNADLFDGVFIGTTLGGKKLEQGQLLRPSRNLTNADYFGTNLGLGDQWTMTGWFNIIDNGADDAPASFEIARIKTTSPSFHLSLRMVKITSGDNAGLYQPQVLADSLESVDAYFQANTYRFFSIRSDAGSITLNIGPHEFAISATTSAASTIDLAFFNANSSFDSSIQAIYYDELYLWDLLLNDGNVAFVYNGGSGRFYDALIGDFEGSTAIPNPADAVIVGVFNATRNVLKSSGGIEAISGANITSTTTAKRSPALYYDGVAGNVSLTQYNYNTGSNELTLSCWVKASGWSGNAYTQIFSTGSWAGGIELTHISSGNVEAKLRYALTYSDAVTMQSNQWHLLCFSVDASNAKFYFDGEIVGTVPVAAFVSGDFYLATAAGTTAWSGSTTSALAFDELLIWDSILTAIQISALYNSGNGKFVGPDGKF